jgi:hypothetical protein
VVLQEERKVTEGDCETVAKMAGSQKHCDFAQQELITVEEKGCDRQDREIMPAFPC